MAGPLRGWAVPVPEAGGLVLGGSSAPKAVGHPVPLQTGSLPGTRAGWRVFDPSHPVYKCCPRCLWERAGRWAWRCLGGAEDPMVTSDDSYLLTVHPSDLG